MSERCFGSHAATLRGDHVRLSETRHRRSLRTPAHSHPFLCLHFVLRGVYEESRNGHTHRVEPGWFLFKPGGQIHWNDFRASGAVTFRLELDADSDPDLVDALPGRMTTFRAPHLANLASRAHGELARTDRLSRLVAESLALELFAGFARRADKGVAGTASSALARRCAELLDARFREPYRLGLAAEELEVDRTALARAFRKEYGCSVGEYIRSRRVQLVAERLRNGSPHSLAELAADAGFADQSHMTRVFKAEFGAPPHAWRTRHGGPARPDGPVSVPEDAS